MVFTCLDNNCYVSRMTCVCVCVCVHMCETCPVYCNLFQVIIPTLFQCKRYTPFSVSVSVVFHTVLRV